MDKEQNLHLLINHSIQGAFSGSWELSGRRGPCSERTASGDLRKPTWVTGVPGEDPEGREWTPIARTRRGPAPEAWPAPTVSPGNSGRGRSGAEPLLPSRSLLSGRQRPWSEGLNSGQRRQDPGPWQESRTRQPPLPREPGRPGQCGQMGPPSRPSVQAQGCVVLC